VKKRLVPSLVVAMIATFSFSSCATVHDRIQSTDAWADQLDQLYAKKARDENVILASSFVFAGSIIAATVANTMHSSGAMNDSQFPFVYWPSYALAGIAAASDVVVYLDYRKVVDDYLDTLRLQANYYNLLNSPLDSNPPAQTGPTH